jgi:hypothetical protein
MARLHILGIFPQECVDIAMLLVHIHKPVGRVKLRIFREELLVVMHIDFLWSYSLRIYNMNLMS